jgi:amino-acid N-acetyltransferase
VFCLTYQPVFFGKLGFREVDRNTLPRKVWSECVRCPKFSNCTEVAMTLRVLDEEVPAPVDPLTALVAMPQRHG